MQTNEQPISLLQYLQDIVVPTNAEFYARNDDLRLAMLASIATLHFLDYAAVNRPEDGTNEEDTLVQLTEYARGEFSFQVVERFGLAAKHCRLSRRNLRGVHSNEHAHTTPSIAGRMCAGATFVGDRTGGIAIRIAPGQFANLENCLRGTVNYYRQTFADRLQPTV